METTLPLLTTGSNSKSKTSPSYFYKVIVCFLGILFLLYSYSYWLGNSKVSNFQSSETFKVLPNAANCTVEWITQPLDHFNYQISQTYQQRVLIYKKYWDKGLGPIFFYCGNEGDVTLYANHTGLMWENAKKFGAALIFAEHRYYGQSHPFHGNNTPDNMQYLTHEQALADYAQLIYLFKKKYQAWSSRVIAFGGSYGGMLAAWFRIKYPGTVTGAIAASAPVLAFKGNGLQFQGNSYWDIVTRNAMPAAGSSNNCATNVRRVWPLLNRHAQTQQGRQLIQRIFRLCDILETMEQVESLKLSLMMAFDNMAMGNFPYPSSYLTGGNGILPAWPVQKACSFLSDNFDNETILLEAMRDAAGVYINASQQLKCNVIPKFDDFDGIWDYQFCTQMLPQETYFNTNGRTDMFWKRTINLTTISDRCFQNWKVRPREEWIRMSYGDGSFHGISNIVFSNGRLDPWSSGGVFNSTNPTIKIVILDKGAHHLDLFFSDKNDPPCVQHARQMEIETISEWLQL